MFTTEERDHVRERIIEMLRESLLQRLLREQLSEEAISGYAREVAEHKRDPYSLVEELTAVKK